MSRKHKTGQPAPPAELQRPQVRIVFNEAGTMGLPEMMGYINAAYNSKLVWPSAYKEYNRIWRSMPEIVMTRLGFTSWARNVRLKVELPDKPSDDDKSYQDFVERASENMEGGFGRFIDTLINYAPFFGFVYFSIVPGRRDPE